MLKKSPGGSIFPYFYKGGELLGLHLGNFGADEDGVIARIKAEEAFFIEQNHSIAVWIDFYQTKLTPRVKTEFIAMIRHIRPRLIKLGLVGCSWMEQQKIKRLVKETDGLSALPIKFFDDPEKAKTWLVSEGG